MLEDTNTYKATVICSANVEDLIKSIKAGYFDTSKYDVENYRFLINLEQQLSTFIGHMISKQIIPLR